MKRLLMIVCVGLLAAPGFGQVEAPTPQPQQNLEQQKKAELEAQVARARADQAKAEADLLRTRQAELRANYDNVQKQYIQSVQAAQKAAGGTNGAYRQFVAAAAARQGGATKKERMAYCGVSTVEPPPVLSEQLKLGKGMGLVVDFVEPSSPAEAAGVKQYDVITKFDDQLVVNQEQFRALVWMKTQSDDVKLSLIRQGQPTVVNVELGQKEVDVPVNAAVDPTPWQLQAGFAPNGDLTLAKRVAVFDNGAGTVAVTNVGDQFLWADNQNTIKATVKAGRAVDLLVEDPAGKEVFKGQVETPEQRKALPPEIGAKLEKVEGTVGGNGKAAVYGLTRGAAAKTARARVLTSTDKDILMLARFDNGKATFVFAFSTADGKTLFNGPIVKDEDRKAIPEAVANQLNALDKNQQGAAEFGVVGGNGPIGPGGGFNAK